MTKEELLTKEEVKEMIKLRAFEYPIWNNKQEKRRYIHEEYKLYANMEERTVFDDLRFICLSKIR